MHELTEPDAILGQFELICADAISVFLTDNVAKYGSSEYLASLYSALLKSDEFHETRIRVISIPDTELGSEFIDQFLGSFDGKHEIMTVPFKKAKYMIQCGKKIGAEICIVADSNP